MAETLVSFTDLTDLNAKVKVVGLKNTVTGVSKPFESVYFTRECLKAILDTPDCTGVRFYLVAHDLTDDTATKPYLTMMAVGEDGTPMKSGLKAYISNDACPPNCPKGLDIDTTLTTTTSI